MFEALRWRLTAWYVLAFAVVFVVIGLVVFGWVRHRLQADVDNAVRQVSDAARATVAEHGDAASSDASVRDLLANSSLSGSADVFVLLLAPDGAIAANPSDVPTQGLPSSAAVSRARDRGEDWRSLSVDAQPLQLRTVAVYGTDGRLIGFVQAGKSVQESDASLRTLAIVIAAGGVAGLALATAGGLFVAGIAIRPVRRGFDRQREFVADASHELRTPLAVIRTNAETIAASRPGDEAAGDIAAEASYMTRLLDDLLVLARSDHGGISVECTRFDLAPAVEGVGRVAMTIAGPAGVSLRTDVRGPLLVEADPERCKELMLILLDNAVKYTPAGGRVTLGAVAEGGDAVIRVSDTGIGVPAEHVPRLFDRFYRVDKARSRAIGGAGLGLSIAREIVDAQGGTIIIESAPGSGTTVTVRLRRLAVA
jgi:two-component system, OmpR family, sensor histidine kinase CiaH